MVDAIENKLQQNQWLGGQQPSSEDAEAFKNMDGTPNVDTHPNAFGWWCLVSRFTDDVRKTWAAAAPAKEAGAVSKIGHFFEKIR